MWELGNFEHMATNEANIKYCIKKTLTDQFMNQFRRSFPDCSISVMLHLPEEHTVVWARQTHVGSSLMGEQEA